jgi:hypothetical protein
MCHQLGFQNLLQPNISLWSTQAARDNGLMGPGRQLLEACTATKYSRLKNTGCGSCLTGAGARVSCAACATGYVKRPTTGSLRCTGG